MQKSNTNIGFCGFYSRKGKFSPQNRMCIFYPKLIINLEKIVEAGFLSHWDMVFESSFKLAGGIHEHTLLS